MELTKAMNQKASKVKVRFRDIPWEKVRNFLLALVAIFFVTMATDAINSSFSVYATDNLGFPEERASFVKMLSLIFSGLAFIPVGYMAYKFGRKRTIMIGVVCIAVALFSAFFVGREIRIWFVVCYFLMNFGNVIVVVNTLPLVLENSDTNTVGIYRFLLYGNHACFILIAFLKWSLYGFNFAKKSYVYLRNRLYDNFHFCLHFS